MKKKLFWALAGGALGAYYGETLYRGMLPIRESEAEARRFHYLLVVWLMLCGCALGAIKAKAALPGTSAK